MPPRYGAARAGVLCVSCAQRRAAALLGFPAALLGLLVGLVPAQGVYWEDLVPSAGGRGGQGTHAGGNALAVGRGGAGLSGERKGCVPPCVLVCVSGCAG